MGKFQPGQKKPLGSGRKSGSGNKRSTHFIETLDTVGLNIPERLFEILPQLSIEKQADILLNLMAYLYPKRKAIEVASSSTEDASITVTFVKSDKSIANS